MSKEQRPASAEGERESHPVRNADDVPSQAACLVTTSWDDGHGLDARLADLLHRKRVQATFYIPRAAKHRGLSDATVRDLATHFEIGGHSLTHPHLNQLDPTALAYEVQGSKVYIEDMTGMPCRMFGYPYGDFNADVVEVVRRAGFEGARTVRPFCDGCVKDPYLLCTTIQACKLSPDRIDLRNPPPYESSLDMEIDIATVPVDASGHYDWLTVARRTFDLVRQRGGTWHLWGHSWEVEACGLWDALSEILDYVMATPGTRSLNNGDLVCARP